MNESFGRASARGFSHAGEVAAPQPWSPSPPTAPDVARSMPGSRREAPIGRSVALAIVCAAIVVVPVGYIAAARLLASDDAATSEVASATADEVSAPVDKDEVERTPPAQRELPCVEHARHIPGEWEVRTEATAANNADWIGSDGLYRIALRARENCAVIGTGQKVMRGKPWQLAITGRVLDNGGLELDYAVESRTTVGGRWTIGAVDGRSRGSGRFVTAANDVSGTVVVRRLGDADDATRGSP